MTLQQQTATDVANPRRAHLIASDSVARSLIAVLPQNEHGAASDSPTGDETEEIGRPRRFAAVLVVVSQASPRAHDRDEREAAS